MSNDPHCSVCRHEKRDDIDIAVGTLGQRATAKQFGISRQSIQRHIERGHLADKPPLVDESLAYGGISDTPPDRPQKRKGSQKPHRKRKLSAPHPFVDRRTVTAQEQTLATITDYPTRKAYVGKLLRTATFNGMPTLERLRGCWPDLSMLQLAEIVAQAAMEADFLRGTRQARRLVVLAKADKIYRQAMDGKDLRTALKALEFACRVDGVSAEPDLVASLAASQSWAIAARVLQAKHPEAFEAIHAELVAEESRRRQALAPITVEATTEG